MTQPNPFAAFQQAQAAQPAANPFAGQPAQPAPGFPQQAANPFGQPAPQQPQQPLPQVPQVQQQLPAAPVGGYGLPDLSDIGESSAREPSIPLGMSDLEFSSCSVKTRQGHTAIITFKVINSQSPNNPPGSVVGFVKKLPQERDKQGTAIGFLLALIRGLAGFSDEATFKAQVPYWSQLLAAALHDPAKFAAWANAGPDGRPRRVRVFGTQGEAIIDKKTKLATGKFYTNCDWSPLA